MTWTPDILQQINTADDLKIAPFRADGQTPGTPTWVWAVVVNNRLFVRAYSGKNSRWYQSAIAQHAGQIHAIGQVFNVIFTPITDDSLNTQIDDAYRAKYANSQYMTHMIRPSARSATVEISLK